jgi:hypothetical protein
MLDPSLLGNESCLAPYPSLVSFLNAHPEVARNPSFYVGQGLGPRFNQDPTTQILEMWRDVLNGVVIFARFGMAVGLLVWLIRTLIDYRRWSRLTKVQTDVHTKLLDRFTANEDLLAYIQSAAGTTFPAVVTDRARYRPAECWCALGTDSLVGARRSSPNGGRQRPAGGQRTSG